MSNPKDFITVNLTHAEVAECFEIAKNEARLPVKARSLYINKSSFQNSLAGAYGMVSVERILKEYGIQYKRTGIGQSPDLNIEGMGGADVKTKRVNVLPSDNYVHEVREVQLTNTTDKYIFCYLKETTVYILGWGSKQFVIDYGLSYKKGQSRIGINGKVWVCQEDCRIIKILSMQPFSSLVNNSDRTIVAKTTPEVGSKLGTPFGQVKLL